LILFVVHYDVVFREKKEKGLYSLIFVRIHLSEFGDCLTNVKKESDFKLDCMNKTNRKLNEHLCSAEGSMLRFHLYMRLSIP
jgi:hypothetical protein